MNGYGGPGVTYANYTQKNYLDTSAFSAVNVFPLAGNNGPTLAQCPTCITKIGTAPRSSTSLRMPSSYNLDASLQRTFNVTKDRVKFIFRADCFDVTNKVTFSMSQTQSISVVAPSNSASSFGRLTGYSGNRRWQFSGRMTF